MFWRIFRRILYWYLKIELNIDFDIYYYVILVEICNILVIFFKMELMEFFLYKILKIIWSDVCEGFKVKNNEEYSNFFFIEIYIILDFYFLVKILKGYLLFF